MRFTPPPPPAPTPSDAALPDSLCATLGCLVDNTRGEIGRLADIAGGVANGVQIASDPGGFVSEEVRGAAESLLSFTLGGLHEFTQPNLNVEWFRDLYAINFGIAVIVMGAIFLFNASRTAAGKMSGTALFESIVIDAPRFLIAGMFAPALAGVFIQLSNALAETFLQAGVGNAEVNIIEQVKSSFAAANPAGIMPNSLITTLMYGAVLLSLMLILLSLVAALLALTLSSVVFPLGYVWTLNPVTKRFGKKIIYIWIALLFAPSVVFLMLGAAMQWVTRLPVDFSDDAMRSIISIIAVAVALFIVALSPWALQKFAPILPVGSGAEGPSLDAPPSETGSSYGSNGSATSRLAAESGTSSGDSSVPVEGSSSGRIAALAGAGNAAANGSADAGAGNGGGNTSTSGSTPGSGTVSGATQGAGAGAAAGPGGAAAGAAAGGANGAASDAGAAASSAGNAAANGSADAGAGNGGGNTSTSGSTPGSGTVSGATQGAGAVPQTVSDEASGDSAEADDDGPSLSSGWNVRGGSSKAGQLAQSIGDLAVESVESVEVESEAR